MSISTQSTCYLIFIFLLSFIQMFSFRGHVAYKNVRRSFERSMEGPGCCYESLLPPPTPHPSPPLPIRPTDSHVLSLSPLPPLVVASQTIAKRSREARGAAAAMKGERV